MKNLLDTVLCVLVLFLAVWDGDDPQQDLEDSPAWVPAWLHPEPSCSSFTPNPQANLELPWIIYVSDK